MSFAISSETKRPFLIGKTRAARKQLVQVTSPALVGKFVLQLAYQFARAVGGSVETITFALRIRPERADGANDQLVRIDLDDRDRPEGVAARIPIGHDPDESEVFPYLFDDDVLFGERAIGQQRCAPWHCRCSEGRGRSI